MPNFRHRLNRTQQKIYDRSNATSSILLTASPRLRHAVALLAPTLQSGSRIQVEKVSQAIADEITGGLGVPRVKISVGTTRPSNARGELHGLYTPSRGGPGSIKVWMITAKRGQVVAFKTFLRTVLHEICHHLDYAHLKLADSFHTDGFYQRESSLFYAIGGVAAAERARQPRRSAPAPRRTDAAGGADGAELR